MFRHPGSLNLYRRLGNDRKRLDWFEREGKVKGMVALLLLLLAQMPKALLSAVSFEGGDEGLCKLPAMARQMGLRPISSFGILWPEDVTSLYKQLETVMQKLGLLSTEQEPLKTIGRLPWDIDRVVVADIDEIVKQNIDFSNYVHTDLIKGSERGKVLLLPRRKWDPKTTLGINKRRYDLIGGVAEVWKRHCPSCRDENYQHLYYMAFTTNEKGIASEELGHTPFITLDYACFGAIPLKRNEYILPYIAGIAYSRQVCLSYKYLIYQDSGPLESAYPIRHLHLNDQLVTDNYVRDVLGIKKQLDGILGQGIALIRFIQLWAVIRPDDDFESGELEEIKFRLENLSDGETEQIGDLLVNACRLIQSAVNDDEEDDDSEDSYYSGEDDDQLYPFLKALMVREPTIGASFYIDPEELFAPKEPFEGYECDNLTNDWAFSTPSLNGAKDVPYWVNIPCRGDLRNQATFKLIAIIDWNGRMTTIGIDYDHLGDDMIFKLAHYGSQPYVEISNSPIPDAQKLSVEMPYGILIYQHVIPEGRFKRMKCSAPRSPVTVLMDKFKKRS